MKKFVHYEIRNVYSMRSSPSSIGVLIRGNLDQDFMRYVGGINARPSCPKSRDANDRHARPSLSAVIRQYHTVVVGAFTSVLVNTSERDHTERDSAGP